MKRYIRIALCALIAQYGLWNVVYGMKIAPVTVGKDAIVDSIKQHSNLTEADVNQWKLLWLGNIGTVGAFIAGAASTIGAGVKTYEKSGMVQNIAPEQVPSWMTNPVALAALVSFGAGYMSYKTLYPRIRAGVVAKIQKFINVCDALHFDSPVENGQRFSIVMYNFPKNGYGVDTLRTYLPKSWSSRNDVAVYNALNNLAKQGERAGTLLNQIGTDGDDLDTMREIVKTYSDNLADNTKLYEFAKGDEQIKRRKEAELAGIEAGTSLMKAKTIETYAGMATGAARSIWKGANFLYEKKEYIMGAAASLGAVSAYNFVKAKLGYGQ